MCSSIRIISPKFRGENYKEFRVKITKNIFETTSTYSDGCDPAYKVHPYVKLHQRLDTQLLQFLESWSVMRGMGEGRQATKIYKLP